MRKSSAYIIGVAIILGFSVLGLLLMVSLGKEKDSIKKRTKTMNIDMKCFLQMKTILLSLIKSRVNIGANLCQVMKDLINGETGILQ